MATFKKTSKVAKVAVEVKTTAELSVDLATAQSNLAEAKRGHKLGELANPCVIRNTRKEIARLHTAIRADEMISLKESK
jgi:ribosomal protein L29